MTGELYPLKTNGTGSHRQRKGQDCDPSLLAVSTICFPIQRFPFLSEKNRSHIWLETSVGLINDKDYVICKKPRSHFRKHPGSSSHEQTELPRDPLLGSYIPERNENMCSHKNLYITLFIMAKMWKPKCLSISEWINKM